MMKTVTIDELLAWAFVHELPKGGGVDGLANANSAWRMLQASSWGKVTSWAELMTLVDTGRGDADNFMIEQGAPHDDALAVGEAVAELVNCDIIVPDGWSPLCDWPTDDERVPALRDAAVAAAVERFQLRPAARQGAHLVSLVIGSAVLGREPAWDAPLPRVRMVERGGQPAWFVTEARRDPLSGKSYMVEVQGYDGKKHRAKRGAYRKFQFSDDPAGDILARLDRELWAAALETVEKDVSNRLGGHRLSNSSIERAPWGDTGARIQLLARHGLAMKKTA